MRFCRSSLFVLVLAVVVVSPTHAQPARGFGRGAVIAVQATSTTDLVLLDSGYNAGLRAGMVCHVTRGSIPVGDVLLVELRPAAAAALILGLSFDQSIRLGDQVAVKVLKS